MLTIKQITTKIRSIARRNATLRDDIQTVMVNLAGHAYEHGDVSAAGNLLNAVVGQDKVAIVRFLRDHCFVNVSNEGKVTLNRKARSEADFADGAACVASLTEHAPKWYEAACTTEQAAKILDPIQALDALLKRIQKADSVKYTSLDDVEERVNKIAEALELTNAKAQNAELADLLAA